MNAMGKCGVACLGTLLLCESFAGGRAAAAPADGSLQVRVALGKMRYLLWEEMPVAIAVTNASPDQAEVRLPEAMRSLRLEIVDARTGKPLEPAVSFTRAEPGLGLTFRAGSGPGNGANGKAGAPAAADGKSKGSEPAGAGRPPGTAFSRAPGGSPIVTLPAGSTAVTDFEVLFL